MEITFERIEQYFGKDAAYVSEFEVTADFNLHIERKKGGRFLVYQKSVADGEYDIVDGVGRLDHKDVIDTAVRVDLFPMWCKIVSASEVTMAAVNPDGAVVPVKIVYDSNAQADLEYMYNMLQNAKEDGDKLIFTSPISYLKYEGVMYKLEGGRVSGTRQMILRRLDNNAIAYGSIGGYSTGDGGYQYYINLRS